MENKPTFNPAVRYTTRIANPNVKDLFELGYINNKVGVDMELFFCNNDFSDEQESMIALFIKDSNSPIVK